LISVAFGSPFSTISSVFFITVTVIKKNNNIKTISGNEAVETSGALSLFPIIKYSVVIKYNLPVQAKAMSRRLGNME